MTPTVLVTGGFGYVGGRVACALSQAGYAVRLATRQADAIAPRWLPNAEVVRFDSASPAVLDTACAGVEAVVHLAALNEIDSGKLPVEACDINTTGTVQLLLAAQRQDVTRFLYFSTAHIYGAPLIGTITEETLPRPAHPYSLTHRAAEDWVLAAHDRRDLMGIVVRLSNGFGAPTHPEVNRWTLIANDLCRQAITERKLTLRSSGLQIRDFVTLEDVGAAVVHLLRLPGERLSDGVFNLGGNLPLAMYALAQIIQKRCAVALGYTPPIERPEPKPGETAPALDFRIDKLLETGFRLTGNVDAEIDATLALCREAFALPVSRL